MHARSLLRQFPHAAAVAGLACAVAGCSRTSGQSAGAPCAGPHTQAIVFVDRSVSSTLDAPTRALFSDSLSSIAGLLRVNGDGVHAFQVHEFTRGKAGRVDVADTLCPITENVPSAVKAVNVARFNAATQQLRSTATSRLRTLGFVTPVPPAAARHTDLLGTLEVISEEAGQAGPNDVIRVYFFSDMRESMAGQGRRDFDRRAPRTAAEAVRWADQDVQVVRQMNVRDADLRRAQITIVQGNLAMRPGATEVKAYWLRLFQNLGVPSSHLRFN